MCLPDIIIVTIATFQNIQWNHPFYNDEFCWTAQILPALAAASLHCIHRLYFLCNLYKFWQTNLGMQFSACSVSPLSLLSLCTIWLKSRSDIIFSSFEVILRLNISALLLSEWFLEKIIKSIVRGANRMFGLNCAGARSHRPNLFYISLSMFNYEFLLQSSRIHCEDCM